MTLLWCCCLAILFGRVVSTPDPAEVSALLGFRARITSTGALTNWTRSNSQQVCFNWEGVTCDSSARHVVELRLSNLTLKGTVFLSGLEFLRKLYLQTNGFTGNFPMLNSSKLEIIDLSMNSFSGELPSFLGQFGSLKVLNLSSNNFQGKLPPGMGDLISLECLGLFHNHLSGVVQRSFSRLNQLRILSLGVNEFTGGFPMMNSTNLELIDLRGNRFKGELPDSLPHRLRVLSLGLNEFGGYLPKWISQLSQLQILDLSNNDFQGQLSMNFSGFIQSNNGKPAELYQEIQLSVKGRRSVLFASVSTMTLLDLSNNQLQGKIPPSLGKLDLQYLNLSSNNFSGEIPSELGDIKSLEQLDLSYNHLDGGIPESLANITRMSAFDVSHNNLRGAIPEGGQFNTFDNSSYLGNKDLCGFPLPSCSSVPPAGIPVPRGNVHLVEFGSLFRVAFGVGCFVGYSAVLLLVIFWKRARDFTFHLTQKQD